MSDRKLGDTRTIHPRALDALGLEAALVMLGVADDLRAGNIGRFDMTTYSRCGSPRCIGGHVLHRLGYEESDERAPMLVSWIRKDSAVSHLFSGENPSDPQLAARAIERYVIDGADDPWGD